MVLELAEQKEERSKSDRKTSPQKTKVIGQFSNIVDTSCTKLSELFTCHKVAHSVIFYVIISLFLLALVYLFRKLVSSPTTSSRYHGRKHNSSATASAGSQNDNNNSLSTGFPTKWSKLNKILGKLPTKAKLESTDLNSETERKIHSYDGHGIDWDKQLNNNGTLKPEKSTYSQTYGNIDRANNNFNRLTIYPYLSNNNIPKDTQENLRAQTSNKLQTAYLLAPNQITSNEYGSTLYKFSPSNPLPNSRFKPSDSWSSVSWDSSFRPWSYSGSSEEGLANSNDKLRSHYQNTPSLKLHNDGASGSWSWVKWSKPGSGPSWIESTENDDYFKTTPSPGWFNYYADSASGKWNYKNNEEFTFNNEPTRKNTPDSFPTSRNQIFSPYSWNNYSDDWGVNQTQDWSNSDDPSNRISTANIDKENNGNIWNYKTTFRNNAFPKTVKPSHKGSSSMIPQDDTDLNWEEGFEDLPTKLQPTVSSSRKKKIFQNKQKKRAQKKKHGKRFKKKTEKVKAYKSRDYFKKSVIRHPISLKLDRKSRRKKRKKPKNIQSSSSNSRKVKHKKKQHSRKELLKVKHKNSQIKPTRTQRMIRHKQKDLDRKWRRKVHHVKRCKKLKSFQTNGEVRLDKIYLEKQRKYKYIVLSCRYTSDQINTRRHKRRIYNQHFNYNHDLDKDNENDENTDDDEDEIFPRQKKICRKLLFVTNGNIVLRKTHRSHNQISYTISLCRTTITPETHKYSKTKVSHFHKTTPSPLHDDNYETLEGNKIRSHRKTTKHSDGKSNIAHERDNEDLWHEDDVVTDDDVDKRSKDTKQSKRKTHNKSYQIGNIKEENDNEDVDNDTTRPDSKMIKNHDEDNFDDREPDMDGGDVRNKKSNSAPKNQFKDSDENTYFENKIDEGETADNENAESDDNDDAFRETSAGRLRSHKEIRSKKYKNRHEKKRKPTTKHNQDDIEGQDIDDIDDLEDKVDSEEEDSSTTRQNSHDNVHEDRLSDDGFDNDLDDDIDDDDIMDVNTKYHHKQTVSPPMLYRRRRIKNRHKAVKNKLRSTPAPVGENIIYERLLNELTRNRSPHDNSKNPKTLLAAIIKQKLSSVSSPKHVKPIVSPKNTPEMTTVKNTVNRKKSRQFKPRKIQHNEKIEDLFKNMLTNSINVKSLSQAMKLQSAVNKDNERTRKPHTTTPKPFTKLSMKDLLKQFLPNVLASQTQGESTPPPTERQTEVPTTSNQQDNKQFAKLLRQFVMQNNMNVPATKVLTTEASSKEPMNNTLKDTKDVNKLPKASDAMSPDTKLKPHRLPSQEQVIRQPSKHKQSPPSMLQRTQQPSLLPTPLSPSSDQQQPPQNEQISNTSPYLPYLKPEPNQLQTNVLKSFIPTAQISRPIGVPQSPQQVKSSYAYPAYSSSQNSRYSSYPTQQSIMNVLCFGDSLTSGYYNHGLNKHPYSIKLKQLLNSAGSNRYRIDTSGVIGEMVHGSMTKRLPKVLNKGTHYDWVLILGGTNDVAHVKNFGDDQDFTRQLIGVWSPKIVKDIKKLHEIARRYGARTVLMTIPETAYELWPAFRSIRNMRLSVNAALRKYAAEVRDTTVLCDLAYKLPRSTFSKEMQKVYWNDHIHLNPVGYDRMAEIIQQCIQPYLTK